MEQPKTGFYMGVKGLTKNGDLIKIENTYGPFRTTFIITCMIVGAGVIGMKVGDLMEEGIHWTKVKIKEHKNKKNLESK